jgi:hypothetical protein
MFVWFARAAFPDVHGWGDAMSVSDAAKEAFAGARKCQMGQAFRSLSPAADATVE